MPIHDWTRVSAGTWHDFHLAWIAEIRNALNGGILPADYYAQAEQSELGGSNRWIGIMPGEYDKRAALEEAMPMHDWTRVEAGIFHAFHHNWIAQMAQALNSGLLPDDYYALPEQQAAGFGPDVLALQSPSSAPSGGSTTLVPTRPQTRFTAETDAEFYRRKKSSIVVRHVSGDRIVAMLEVVSSGNKASRHALRAFVAKACELLEYRIHLLIVDPFPPGPRDPNGIHAVIWEEVEDKPFELPEDKPLTQVSYECDVTTRAYIEPFAVGDRLQDMALYLEANGHVRVPLEATYQAAFAGMPRRWRTVLEQNESS